MDKISNGEVENRMEFQVTAMRSHVFIIMHIYTLVFKDSYVMSVALIMEDWC